ncbi:Fibronectin type III domain protein [Enhygromyxa salina]|uniref:Fibronectin type III domain protein n=1 Tax=Enhygromyxa salina TaxID=215803 RepID=A0A0C1ZWU8_9BACT|nr:LamG-like jellyroll fold domain-containing protein [Enhygromyxa salina]KIG15528.1 Fibronectin type III domain protein [Enhygromyxa salina]
MRHTTSPPPSKFGLLPALLTTLALAGCADEGLDEGVDGSSDFRGLEDGLLLRWTFEDRVGTKITDVSGNNRHGTLQGGSFVSSPFGEAVSLDGIDDYISFAGPRAPSLYGGTNGNFTVSARVQVADLGKYNTLCVGCGPLSVMYVGTAGYGKRVMSAIYNQNTQGMLWPTSSESLLPDTWAEVTMIVEAGVAARYYFNCQFDSQLANAGVGLKDYGYSTIGQGVVADRWFQGQIDDLRIWNRALSEAELTELCPTPPLLEQGLELNWTFEDHDGDQITDMSGHGRHGTLQSGAALVSSPAGQAVSLDGIDDRISFVGPRSPALYGGVDGDFTLSARMRVADVAKYNALCYGCGPSQGLYVGDPGQGGQMSAALNNQGTQGLLWAATPYQEITANEWTEVTMVVDGGVATRLYVDCAMRSELQNPAIGLKDYGYSAVGQGGYPNSWFGGEIDQLRIWSRALPAEELALLCVPSPCDGPIHVNVSADPGGDGRSWATAFNDLQAAINASAQCSYPEVWVAEGTYAPTPGVPVATITAPMAIYGGFDGTEDALEQRDVGLHPVRLGADGWTSRVVVIESSAVSELESLWLDGFTISGSSAGAIQITAALAPEPPTSVFLHNLTITGNAASAGAGILTSGAGGIEIATSHFEANSAPLGGAIRATGTSLDVSSCEFVDNDANRGAALHLGGNGGAYNLTQNDFSGNSATTWGGAIFLDDDPADPGYMELTIEGGEFIANDAVQGGGAIYAEESTTTIQSVVFANNLGGRGGAVEVANGSGAVNPDVFEIIDCRFIANQATVSRGGGLLLTEAGTTVINTEFASNIATSSGGGVYGRGTFIHSTFANNAAASGAGLYAPPGPDMTMRHCAAWPDLIVGQDIYMGWSCGAPETWLLANGPGVITHQTPFDPADLDDDGRVEYYLRPGTACADFGGETPEFDTSALTTMASQCTDSSPVDIGVHYTPLFAAGACG